MAVPFRITKRFHTLLDGSDAVAHDRKRYDRNMSSIAALRARVPLMFNC